MSVPAPSIWRSLRPPVASIVVAIGFLAAGIIMAGQRDPGMDSAVYQAGALAVLRGDALYGSLNIPPPWMDLPFTYPPVAAFFFMPLAPFPMHVVWGIMAGVCALALGIAVRHSLRSLTGNEPSALLVNVASLVPFGLQAVWSTVGLGQINLLLMALIMVDILALRGSRFAGILTGIAASIKLTPLIFIPHLLITRRWADAGRATATFVVLQGLAWLILPADSLRFWTKAMMEGNGSRTFEAANQSINGLVQRLTGEAPGAMGISLALAAVCGGLMVLLVHRLHETEPLAALLVTGLSGLLISPVTWTHHWVWVVPLCLLLAYRALQRNGWTARVLLALVLVVFSVDFRLLVPIGNRRELTWTMEETLIGNSYLWAALVVGLAGLAFVVRSRQQVLAIPAGSIPAPRRADEEPSSTSVR
ncbi:glycosyltransferase 87 family protein [Catelliglobosispora koreensis]|uniref:glycosyltransferase 87 family protein n=1 Tax=Catelliglobosispora koreensis TaxID=129052 RepID=UPI00036C080E|nr:glycosyltransferase 87 family protein [Catelliglobosispora koreensis]